MAGENSERETQAQYRKVLNTLLSFEHVFYSPPASPHKLLISQQPQQASGFQGLPTIASLDLHPVIEALLHLLNCDLPSAHFLCRHAETKPKWESMYVHGILHRIEGDIDNTRCWYPNVEETEIFKSVWADQKDGTRPAAAQKGWKEFLNRLDRWRDSVRSRNGVDKSMDWVQEEKELRETSLWEMQHVLEYCEKKFGLKAYTDATSEWNSKVNHDDPGTREMAQKMVTGGEGWRTF